MRFTLNTVVLAIASASLTPSVWAVPFRGGRSVARSPPDGNELEELVNLQSSGWTRPSGVPIVVRDQGSNPLKEDVIDVFDALGAVGNSTDAVSDVLGEIVGIVKVIQGNSKYGTLDVSDSDKSIISDLIHKMEDFITNVQGNSSYLETVVTRLSDDLANEGITPNIMQTY